MQGGLPDCEHFGLELVCEDPNGGVLESCVEGTKAKCASPPASPLANPTPATTLKVLAYNAFELRYLYWQSGQRERTCRIVHEVIRMHPDIDVIIWNEFFMGGCFAPYNTTVDESLLTIREILDQHGFYYYTDTVGVGFRQGLQFENGGAFIASRWPMVYNATKVYENVVFYEFMAKGVVYAGVKKTVGEDSAMFHVFGTHMQAFRNANEDEIRVLQAQEIHNFMLAQNIPTGEPVIYGGDLNARLNTTNGDDVVNALDATLPPNVGELTVTYDPVNNDLFVDSNDSSWWIDYVLYSNIHVQPEFATVEVVRPLMEVPLNICDSALSGQPAYPASENCLITKLVQDISDHYAVLGAFEYGDEILLTPTPANDNTDGPTMAAPTTVSHTTESKATSRFSSVWLLVTFILIALFMKN